MGAESDRESAKLSPSGVIARIQAAKAYADASEMAPCGECGNECAGDFGYISSSTRLTVWLCNDCAALGLLAGREIHRWRGVGDCPACDGDRPPA